MHRDTLAAASAIYQGDIEVSYPIFIFSRSCTELHGNADGSIPATFQVIYMVLIHPFFHNQAELILHKDRMETCSNTTQTSRTWFRVDQFERYPVGRVGICTGLKSGYLDVC